MFLPCVTSLGILNYDVIFVVGNIFFLRDYKKPFNSVVQYNATCRQHISVRLSLSLSIYIFILSVQMAKTSKEETRYGKEVTSIKPRYGNLSRQLKMYKIECKGSIKGKGNTSWSQKKKMAGDLGKRRGGQLYFVCNLQN